jgi:hypothetical protein
MKSTSTNKRRLTRPRRTTSALSMIPGRGRYVVKIVLWSSSISSTITTLLCQSSHTAVEASAGDRPKAEYMDIHDHRNPSTDNVRQNNLPVLTTKQMQNWFGSMKPTSVVHYTYSKSMYYRLRVVLIGELTE